MVLRHCTKCGGKRRKGTTDFIKHMDKVTLRIRNVPVEVCGNCGEKFYSLKVARKIEEIVETYKEMMSKISPKETMAREIDFSAPGADEACA
ncbi:type II toxin-antitoxin system MqsA family antitoxin [Methanocella paludicola]|uniref:type II toxin-antitoxin system MqsA family antitoxin n=1 Tax=Methanocella paludicola TaxID=570267 RepID=UPI000FFB6A85|nr:type II toxin-antitoxin system MqsA family antitoxin [Methanocella paludicola]